MNIINAIMNLVQNPITQLVDVYQDNNRANNAGAALEEYIKDLFANSFELPEKDRLKRLNDTFSYLGNNSNPPDAMLKKGDAIEVKKIETDNAELQLNSSYPAHTLRASDPMITSACRNAENPPEERAEEPTEGWTEKDIIYTVGVVKQKCLKHLCMVYGLDYCASEECYDRIKNTIKTYVESISGIEFAESRELSRINRVDPLGITDLRIRGMWKIKNPWQVFDYVYTRDLSKNFTFMCIINEVKWSTFENTQELLNLEKDTPNLFIDDIQIKNPDNPAQLNNAKLIRFSI